MRLYEAMFKVSARIEWDPRHKVNLDKKIKKILMRREEISKKDAKSIARMLVQHIEAAASMLYFSRLASQRYLTGLSVSFIDSIKVFLDEECQRALVTEMTSFLADYADQRPRYMQPCFLAGLRHLYGVPRDPLPQDPIAAEEVLRGNIIIRDIRERLIRLLPNSAQSEGLSRVIPIIIGEGMHEGADPMRIAVKLCAILMQADPLRYKHLQVEISRSCVGELLILATEGSAASTNFGIGPHVHEGPLPDVLQQQGAGEHRGGQEDAE